MSASAPLPKRLLVGRPLRSARVRETLLPKRPALPVFCSDPLSSNAYATEEILSVLSVGGLALLNMTLWIAAAAVLIDYVMTVVMPVAAGVANTVSAFPELCPMAPPCLGTRPTPPP